MRKLKVEELGRLSVEAFKEAPKFPLVVVLDNVRSMHNVGSVFRTADAFRVEQLFLCGITPRPPHREIRKTALGAEESVAWIYKKEILPLLEALSQEGYRLIAVEQTTFSTELNSFLPKKGEKYAVIFGHEVEGVQQAVIDRCAASLEIPQFGTKHSLNLSVATGIVLYHFMQYLKGE